MEDISFSEKINLMKSMRLLPSSKFRKKREEEWNSGNGCLCATSWIYAYWYHGLGALPETEPLI